MKYTLIFPCTMFLVLSCTTATKYINIHNDFALKNNCIFEKLTSEEKEQLAESVGRKIYRNQENCRLRHETNKTNADAHNSAHRGG